MCSEILPQLLVERVPTDSGGDSAINPVEHRVLVLADIGANGMRPFEDYLTVKGKSNMNTRHAAAAGSVALIVAPIHSTTPNWKQ
jgi:hypothetical protein